jgi:hypothetical protein
MVEHGILKPSNILLDEDLGPNQRHSEGKYRYTHIYKYMIT